MHENEINAFDAYFDFIDEPQNNSLLVCEEVWRIFMQSEKSDRNYTNFSSLCLNGTFPVEFFTQPYILPWYQQLAWCLVFAVMILSAIVGNLLVIWIIVAHRHMRTVTNLFLLNLALADFLLASGNAAFNFVFMLNSHWPFGSTFCVISNFLATLTVSTSVFTILAVSLDRFVAVTRPLRPRMTKGVAIFIIFSVWFVSSFISIPPLLYATTVTYKYSDDQYRTLCHLVWPDTQKGSSYLDHIYNVVFFIVTYVIPMSCMTLTYSWVGCILWGSKVIGENSEMQSQVIKSKQKVVHLLIAVVLLFAICWLPYHVYFLYTYYNNEILRTHFIQHVYLAIYWLAMSNSCYNPIIYYIMNVRFRNYFQQVLCMHSTKHTSATSDQRQKTFPMTARGTSLLTSYRRNCSRKKSDKAEKMNTE